MPDPAATRRGLLAAAGGAMLAGCSGLDSLTDDSVERIPTGRLPDATTDGAATPVVVETVPVEIARSLLDARRQRTTDLLARLPLSFGAGDVPNGYVRERLVGAAEHASEHVADARTAGSRLVALESLRSARSEARYAAAGWGFVEDGTTEAALRDEHDGVVDDARSLRSDHDYVGDDPVEAALLHARIEQHLERVLEERGPPRSAITNDLLTVAEWGEHAESARARVDDSRYLYDRFQDSLPADAGSVEATLSAAADELVADLQGRRNDLPPEPTEHDQRLASRLRARLRYGAESSARHAPDAPGPASTVLEGVEGIAAFLAYEAISERIDDGETFSVESAGDVISARSDAVDAIQTALEESPRSDLARPALARAAQTVAAADAELGRLRGSVRPARLHDAVRRYLAATARARSVPAACERALATIE